MGERLRKSEWAVGDVERSVGALLVAQYHYAQSGPNTATYLHGLFRPPDWFRCRGVAWWIPPTKSAAQANFCGDWRRVLSLSRLVIEPESPTNAASFLIGQSVRRIKNDGRFDCLLTYADGWQGHTGGIYKATNWEYRGTTQPEATWIDGTTGQMVARKAGSRTRTQAQMHALGHKKVGAYHRHRFRMLLTRG